jgi:hypothetical protein
MFVVGIDGCLDQAIYRPFSDGTTHPKKITNNSKDPKTKLSV